jgi:AbrB family looped-hinge helix DNA binding protein
MMRITSKGQVTIPAEIREQAGLLPHTDVEFEFRTNARTGDERGARLVAHLRGRGDLAMSTDAIMALTRDDWSAFKPSMPQRLSWLIRGATPGRVKTTRQRTTSSPILSPSKPKGSE